MRLLCLVLAPALVFAGRYCPDGSFDVPQQNKCIHTESNGVTFDIASRFCNYIGGNVVKITNAFLNAVIAGQALSILSGQNAFIGVVQSSPNTWKFVDGSDLTYTNWKQGEPQAQNNCAAIDPMSNMWISVDCNKPLPYFCGIPDVSTPCPNGWTYFFDTESCYYVQEATDPPQSFLQKSAEDACVKRKSHLASIHTAREDDFVMRILQTNSANSQMCDRYEAVLGLSCTNAQFAWTDGTPVDYKRQGTVQCTSQNLVYAIINDPACNTTQYQKWDEWTVPQQFGRYVCKRPAY